MTITHQKYTGRTLYLMVETSPGVYAQVGGLRADSLSIGNEEVDITDKSDDLWKKLLAGGNRTLAVSGSGFVTNSAAFEALQAAADAGTPINGKLVYKAGKAYAAPFLVASCELNGEYNGAQQFSASLSSMNTPYIGIAGAVPTLDLNFAETGSLQPSIGTATASFTRSTSKVYRDVDGYLKTTAINAQAFEHDAAGNRMGYIPEPASTNLLLRSQEFDNASWSKTNITASANAGVAPDTTATADLLLETTPDAGHIVAQSISKAASAIQYTLSVFAKNGGRFRMSLSADDAGGSAIAQFNLNTGAVLSSNAVNFTGLATAIAPYRDGWYRLSLTFTTTAQTTLNLNVQLHDDAGSSGYIGDVTKGIYVWAAQIEAQPETTSYIVTTSASATRGGDVLTYTGITGLSVTEGALVVEFYEPATSATTGNGVFFAALNDNTNNERCVIFRNPDNGTNYIAVTDGGAAQADFSAAALALGAVARIAVGLKANDFAASFQGAAVQTDTSGTMFTPTQLQVGHVIGVTQPTRPIKRVTYYAAKPANADIVALAA